MFPRPVQIDFEPRCQDDGTVGHDGGPDGGIGVLFPEPLVFIDGKQPFEFAADFVTVMDGCRYDGGISLFDDPESLFHRLILRCRQK